MVISPLYLIYHLALVPVLHIAALTLFVTSDKDGVRPHRREDHQLVRVFG